MNYYGPTDEYQTYLSEINIYFKACMTKANKTDTEIVNKTFLEEKIKKSKADITPVILL